MLIKVYWKTRKRWLDPKRDYYHIKADGSVAAWGYHPDGYITSIKADECEVDWRALVQALGY